MATFADEVDITTDAASSDTKMAIEIKPLSCDSTTTTTTTNNYTNDNNITTLDEIPRTTTCQMDSNEYRTSQRSTRMCRACKQPCLKNDDTLVRALGETYHYHCFICEVKKERSFFFLFFYTFKFLFLLFLSFTLLGPIIVWGRWRRE